MKILELSLTNFAPIESGIGKEHIHLNLRNSNELITVIIGKIGSGKTYILSHLQPFATVGTLDIRNQDDPIIPKKDGKKVIIYQKGTHEYVITHNYHWTGKTHSTKSYIEKDGIELNENGNVSSFKDIIQLEFGIDQSFLRLLRLGPNVINFINMKATERKSYIASLLASTEVYLMFHKYWSSDLRTVNTKATILMNKLNQYNAGNSLEIKSKLEDLELDISEITDVINDLTKSKYQLQAENTSLVSSYNEIQNEYAMLKERVPEVKTDIDSLSSLIDSFKDCPSALELNKIIGSLDSKMSSLEDALSSLDDEYNKTTDTLNTLKDRKAIMGNPEHVKTLEETYQDLLVQDAQYKKELTGFKCTYTSAFLTGLLGDLNTVNILINEIYQYDTDMVKKLIQSDSSVIQYAQKKVEILGYRKMKLQKLINNLKFSETYEAPSPLYFPPFCPTKTCPYYKTHPTTLQKKNKTKNEVQEQLLSYQNEIRDLDVEIYKYSDYPLVYSKIVTLKGLWSKAIPVLKEIGALNFASLLQVVTNMQYQRWYDYDKIVNTIDLLEKRDKYYSLMDNMKSIKNELTELELSQDSNIDTKISEAEVKQKELSDKIEEMEKTYNQTKDELISKNQLYVDVSQKDVRKEELKQNKDMLKTMTERMSVIENNLEIYQDNQKKIQDIDRTVLEKSTKLKDFTDKAEKCKSILNDIKYTNKELDDVLLEQKYLSQMVDAVSSKKGIPLVMVEMFLDSCRDIINELIYDVCEDELEILPFDIKENEFKIPYMINGKRVDDISKASQGQSSIVSTAFSFALVRKTGSTEYNIPLLDEMDGPLHKSDKQKYMAILFKHLKEIGSEQSFNITHDDNTFDGYPVQVIMTTDENINKEKYTNIIKL